MNVCQEQIINRLRVKINYLQAIKDKYVQKSPKSTCTSTKYLADLCNSVRAMGIEVNDRMGEIMVKRLKKRKRDSPTAKAASRKFEDVMEQREQQVKKTRTTETKTCRHHFVKCANAFMLHHPLEIRGIADLSKTTCIEGWPVHKRSEKVGNESVSEICNVQEEVQKKVPYRECSEQTSSWPRCRRKSSRQEGFYRFDYFIGCLSPWPSKGTRCQRWPYGEHTSPVDRYSGIEDRNEKSG